MPLPANTAWELTYFVRLGVGSQQGDGINRATARFQGVSAQVRSNTAQFRVRVQGGVFSNDGCIIGKVYVDCDGNSVQNNESGSREAEVRRRHRISPRARGIRREVRSVIAIGPEVGDAFLAQELGREVEFPTVGYGPLRNTRQPLARDVAVGRAACARHTRRTWRNRGCCSRAAGQSARSS